MDQEEKQRLYDKAEVLLSEQNFPAAVIVGAVAAILAAVAYALVVSKWSFSYGFAAAAIGIVVGISMQYLGRGIETKFAVVASVCTIAGCILGNIFKPIIGMMRIYRVSPIEVLQDSEMSTHIGWSISFVDLVFWFVAIFAAVFLAKRPLSRSDKLALGMHDLKD